MIEQTDKCKIYTGNCLEVLKTLPAESVDCIITSPPYWSLRDYGEETNIIWDGDQNCEHEWITEKNMHFLISRFSFSETGTEESHVTGFYWNLKGRVWYIWEMQVRFTKKQRV